MIAHYIHEKSIIEIEMMQLKSVYGSYKVHNIDSDWYSDKMHGLIQQRDNLDNLINEVKRNRLNKQKLSASKK